MNRSYFRIISEYGDADFSQRLDMYVQFRELRSEFIQIDRDDLNTDPDSIFKWPGNSLSEKVSAVINSVAVSAKKLVCPASAQGRF